MKQKSISVPYQATPERNDKQTYHTGRGAQINTHNRFLKTSLAKEELNSIDDWDIGQCKTQYLEQEVKTIVNKVDSPDLGMDYSMNPYAGCEHGCIYCYARNVHEYWGYSAGLDFERKIVVKINAANVLRKTLLHPKWDPLPIMLSGNTDCYQPAEDKYRLTRSLLNVCNDLNQPVSILTKNSRVIKDIDILKEMASKHLVTVMVSITTFNEEIRRAMEPRTSTAAQRLRVIEEPSKAGIRTGVMMGPMIPGLNDHELQAIMKSASEAGAQFASYTFIRLNGSVKLIFHDWLYKNFPDKANKIWHLIEDNHDGKVNDSRFGIRIKGEGAMAKLIHQQFKKYSIRYGFNDSRWKLNSDQFKRPGMQGKLF